MANSFTTLGFTKPEVGADTNLWGGHLNSDWDLADTLIQRLVGTTTTHLLTFNVNAVSTTTTRTVTWSDADVNFPTTTNAVTLVDTSATQTLVNKTLTNAQVNTQTAGSSTTVAASTEYVGWFKIGTANAAAATTVDFVSISSTVNHLLCMWELKPGTNGVNIGLRTYGADGVVDSGSVDYYYTLVNSDTAGGSSVSASSGTTNGALTGTGISTGTNSAGGRFEAFNIQALTATKFTLQSSYLDSAGVVAVAASGTAVRVEADRITGIRLFPTSGNFTGKVTLFGSV